jgi:hypothetical protein
MSRRPADPGIKGVRGFATLPAWYRGDCTPRAWLEPDGQSLQGSACDARRKTDLLAWGRHEARGRTPRATGDGLIRSRRSRSWQWLPRIGEPLPCLRLRGSRLKREEIGMVWAMFRFGRLSISRGWRRCEAERFAGCDDPRRGDLSKESGPKGDRGQPRETHGQRI